MIATIILFFVVLSALVLVHEWGHYITAKKAGMKVEEFGIGFPPKIYSWKGKDGMEWSINLIPIGGFVRIKGETGEKSNDPDAFVSKSILSRTIVLAAGVFMNLVLAAVLYSVAFMIGMPSVTEGWTDTSATITDEKISITQVLESSPAAIAGLEAGDEVIAINTQEVISSEQAWNLLEAAPADTLTTFDLIRNNEPITLEATPAYIEQIDRPGFGLAILQTGTVQYPWYKAPVEGVILTGEYTVAITVALYDLAKNLITGAGVSQDLAGPVGIAVMTGEVAAMGFVYLLQFAAILSINLAIINILPFPALDGGRMLFVFIEAVRRKPVSQKLEAVVHNSGFLILILLIILVTYRDIIKLI